MIRYLVLLGLLCVPAAVRANWYEASGKHFVVYSQQQPKAITAYVEQLERYDAAMRVMRGLDDPAIDPANRVTVFVVPDLSLIQRTGGAQARGVYNTGTHPIALVPAVTGGETFDLDGGSVLRHEYAHHFMFSNFGATALPKWLVEGHAEFNATAAFKPDGSVVFGQAPGYRAYGLLAGPEVSLKALFTADTRHLTPEQTDVLYGKSWLLIHYLVFAQGRGDQLGAYIAALRSGKSPLDAASVFGDLNRLEHALGQVRDARQIATYTIPADRMKIGTVTLRPLSAAENAIMPIHIESSAEVDPAQAVRLVVRARAVAASYPADPAVQGALAEAEYDTGNYAACAAAADRTLAADPKSVRGYVYKAMAATATARGAKATDPATWRAIRKDIMAANRLDPDDPRPLVLFYASFGNAGQPATANALTGLRQALALAPSDNDTRWLLADAEIRAKDWPAARETILPLAYAPHPGPKSAAAAALAAAIDGGNSADIAAKAAALEGSGASVAAASRQGTVVR
jgi:hypothetical protein